MTRQVEHELRETLRRFRDFIVEGTDYYIADSDIEAFVQEVHPTATPLSVRVETAYDAAITARGEMDQALDTIRAEETTAKVAHVDEWKNAKTNDVRTTLLASWLQGNTTYDDARRRYDESRRTYRTHLLEIERCKVLVELRKAGP
jgi:hypothetical protein